jgi:hypothetical protein
MGCPPYLESNVFLTPALFFSFTSCEDAAQCLQQYVFGFQLLQVNSFLHVGQILFRILDGFVGLAILYTFSLYKDK